MESSKEKHLFEIFCKIISDLYGHFDQCNTSLVNLGITFFLIFVAYHSLHRNIKQHNCFN